MKVLVICDDHYHPGQVVIDGIAPLGDLGYEFDVVRDGLALGPKSFAGYPAIILSKSDEATPGSKVSWLTPGVQQSFVDYVENGGGLLAIHCGLVPGEKTDVLHGLIGSKFKWHPNHADVTAEPIKPHPVTNGVGQFCELDEHYYLDVLADDIDVLMASYSPAQGLAEKYEADSYNNCPQKIEPCCYVRVQGKGRVCVLTPGHHLKLWHNPNFQKLLDNSLRWCGRA